MAWFYIKRNCGGCIPRLKCIYFFNQRTNGILFSLYGYITERQSCQLQKEIYNNIRHILEGYGV